MEDKIAVLADQLESTAEEQSVFEPRFVEKGVVNMLSLVASNPMTPPETLGAMSKSDHKEILCAIALNPSTDLLTLDELAKNPHASVRACVAKHPSATLFMWRLSNDPNPMVRYKLAGNETVPEHLFKVLLKDSDWRVAKRAKRTLAKLAAKDSIVNNVISKFSHLRRAV